MRTIKTYADLQCLRKAQVFSDSFTAYLEEEFRQLKEAFDFNGADEAFTLDLYGYMTVLEKGDNLFDLSTVGLDRKRGGLLGCLPEFVEKIERDGQVWYKIVVVMTNEYAMAYYIDAKDLEEQKSIILWLEEHVE
jgi:hypothetical protein